MLKSNAPQLIIAIAIPLVIGFLPASFFSAGEWYDQLKKPPLQPPPIVFPIVWPILFVLMGKASFLIWRQGGFKQQALPLILYLTQLVVNSTAIPVTFGLENLSLALIDVALLLVLVIATTILFYPVDKVAAYLLLPYIAWVSFATYLSAALLALNPDSSGKAVLLQQLVQ